MVAPEGRAPIAGVLKPHLVRIDRTYRRPLLRAVVFIKAVARYRIDGVPVTARDIALELIKRIHEVLALYGRNVPHDSKGTVEVHKPTPKTRAAQLALP